MASVQAMATSGLSDEEIARNLQRAEDHLFAQQQQRGPASPPASGSAGVDRLSAFTRDVVIQYAWYVGIVPAQASIQQARSPPAQVAQPVAASSAQSGCVDVYLWWRYFSLILQMNLWDDLFLCLMFRGLATRTPSMRISSTKILKVPGKIMSATRSEPSQRRASAR